MTLQKTIEVMRKLEALKQADAPPMSAFLSLPHPVTIQQGDVLTIPGIDWASAGVAYGDRKVFVMARRDQDELFADVLDENDVLIHRINVSESSKRLAAQEKTTVLRKLRIGWALRWGTWGLAAACMVLHWIFPGFPITAATVPIGVLAGIGLGDYHNHCKRVRRTL